jgi:hypothetical protein
VNFAGHLSITGGKLFGNLSTMSLGSITIQSTTLTSAALAKEVTDFVSTNVAAVNAALATGLAIPSVEGVNISDGEVKNNLGYIELGITLSKAAAAKKSIEIVQ